MKPQQKQKPEPRMRIEQSITQNPELKKDTHTMGFTVIQ